MPSGQDGGANNLRPGIRRPSPPSADYSPPAQLLRGQRSGLGGHRDRQDSRQGSDGSRFGAHRGGRGRSGFGIDHPAKKGGGGEEEGEGREERAELIKSPFRGRNQTAVCGGGEGEGEEDERAS